MHAALRTLPRAPPLRALGRRLCWVQQRETLSHLRDAHADLMTAELWRSKQRAVLEGELQVGLPYAPRYPNLHNAPTIAPRGR